MKKEEFRHLVRVANTDLAGGKNIAIALEKVKGVGFNFAHAICKVGNIDSNKKTGYLTDEEIKKIEDIIKNPSNYNIPVWFFNRRRNMSTGDDKHLVSAELRFEQDFDIKRMKKIKSYKGVRHAIGLPVRGQRTKAHFRRGGTVGFKKKGVKMGKGGK